MNNDLISRSELKAEIQKALDRAELTDYEPSVVICEVYDRCIDNAPTVEPTFREVVAYECGQKLVERQHNKDITKTNHLL